MNCSKKKPLYNCNKCFHNNWCSQGPEYSADVYVEGECSGKEHGWCKHCIHKHSCNGIGAYECEGSGKWCKNCTNYPDWCDGTGWYRFENKRRRFEDNFSGSSSSSSSSGRMDTGFYDIWTDGWDGWD